jgi:superoxide dismutase, Fe-Mn family
MAFTLPNLPYGFDSLEPYIDSTTMQIHHDKHHAAYVNNLNNAIKGTDIENKSLEEILSNISKSAPAVRNNAGGHYNHSLFWTILKPGNRTSPKGELDAAIKRDFESFEKFYEAFNAAATTRFGSGWAWLGVGADKKLCVCSTPNQDNPLMDVTEKKCTPILGLDVWEHAYYLKYQNRRPDYIEAFWNIINWDEVALRFSQIK